MVNMTQYFFCINVDKLFQIYNIQKATKVTYLQYWILSLSQNARNIPEYWQAMAGKPEVEQFIR